jgi:hypothetical protein
MEMDDDTDKNWYELTEIERESIDRAGLNAAWKELQEKQKVKNSLT